MSLPPKPKVKTSFSLLSVEVQEKCFHRKVLEMSAFLSLQNCRGLKPGVFFNLCMSGHSQGSSYICKLDRLTLEEMLFLVFAGL